ncbi:hypothetical protein [Paenibacillus jiagnxiensis]|uniref:hypothetical protein n=1 Tax=Paenibacillus jiagnxiensis TaxID=3228926 RepID=UPI0033BDF00B
MNSWMITSIFFGLFLLLLIVFAFITFVKNAEGKKKNDIFEKHFGKRANQHRLNLIFQKSYVLFQRLPLLRKYIWNIRKRLEVLDSFDEYAIRRQTMRIAFITLSSTTILVLLFCLISRDLFTIFFILFGAVVLNGVMITTFVNRVEDRLLKQSIKLYEDTRHQFQRTKNVEEAIYEASLTAPHEAAQHGERIYEILTADDQQKALDVYYEVAPNKYYKMFTGFSFLVSEFGDRIVRNSSMYLSAIAKLIQDVNYEILRRERLNYLLKGLSTIAVLSVLFIKPIELWAKAYFPIMSDFYASKFGFFIKVFFFLVVLLCYSLIKKLLANDEARYVAKSERVLWEKFLYAKVPPLRFVVDRFVPALHKKFHFQLTVLIKDANSYLTIEWLYVQRILLSLVIFIGSVSMFFYMHSVSVDNVLHDPLRGTGVFGKLGPAELEIAQQKTDFDRSVLTNLDDSTDVSPESLLGMVSTVTQTSKNDPATIYTANRIYQKYVEIQNEYFKWWELLLCMLLAITAYFTPLWLLYFQKKIRYMEMQDEVDQFHTIISILAQFERMDIETVLEWMERYSVIFKDPIKNCLNNYSSGQEEALEILGEDVSFEPFVRIVEKLRLAVEKIPLLQAFDDLELTKEYYAERRKEYFSRLIELKAFWGRIFGLAPSMYLIFLYLVVPMLYLSITQAGASFEQIQSVSGR